MTISEIARMAGVSSAAVSRYLNNGSLSEEKREKIGKVIQETNYQPSEYARAMRTKKSRKRALAGGMDYSHCHGSYF